MHACTRARPGEADSVPDPKSVRRGQNQAQITMRAMMWEHGGAVTQRDRDVEIDVTIYNLS